MCLEATMRSATTLAVLIAASSLVPGCVGTDGNADATDKSQVAAKPVVSEKAFVTGGTASLTLEGGSWQVRAAADNHISVPLKGNMGNAKAELTVDGTHADVKVTDTPNRNFQATIEVPATTDLNIRLGGGEVAIAPIAGNKDLEIGGGNVNISVGDPNDYASVDASVKAGELQAGPFGESKAGLLQHFTWSGRGKYTLRANLGAGNLVLRK